ncbi:MAG: GNAT family N-acetyltransferase [Pseudomonadota bacterium]
MDPLKVDIRIVSPAMPEITTILEAHLDLMRSISPPEAVHALDLDQYEASGTTLFAQYDQDDVVAIGGLREYEPGAFEIKSMHVPQPYRGRKLSRIMLTHLLDVARARGGVRASLETGSQDAFEPARRLYATHGFDPCGPFGTYVLDANSTFMTRRL